MAGTEDVGSLQEGPRVYLFVVVVPPHDSSLRLILECPTPLNNKRDLLLDLQKEGRDLARMT